MRDRPNGADLLAVARRSLLDEVAPALKGQPRYVALMVANAIGIASRELARSRPLRARATRRARKVRGRRRRIRLRRRSPGWCNLFARAGMTPTARSTAH